MNCNLNDKVKRVEYFVVFSEIICFVAPVETFIHAYVMGLLEKHNFELSSLLQLSKIKKGHQSGNPSFKIRKSPQLVFWPEQPFQKVRQKC